MSARETLDLIEKHGVVLVVRCEKASDALPGIEAVMIGGIKAVEITFSVPDAPKVIAQVKQALGAELVLGAGTVMTPEQVRQAVDAGATYLVAPNTDAAVIAEARRIGVPIFAGAFTPTEVVQAWRMGSDVVKIFPASLGGPEYIKALKAPLREIRMMPTGGVNEKTVGEFFAAGAFAVGAGGSLFDGKLLAEKNYKRMTDLADRFVQTMNAARQK